MIRLIIIMALCVYMQAVNAQADRIDTDRPDQTESAVLVPPKWMQFEMGFNKQGARNGDARELLLPTLLSKYGINKYVELRLITTIQSLEYGVSGGRKIRETGLQPVEIGAKIRLAEEKGILPKTSLIFHFAIPSIASDAKRADKVAPNFRFTMQNSITDNVAIGYNLGAEWDGLSNTPTWIYTFAPGFNIGRSWYAYVEAFGFINKYAPPQHSLDAGIAWYANNNIKFDFSGGPGISQAAPPRYVSLGASVRFNTAKGSR
jgi:hypothetical protein